MVLVGGALRFYHLSYQSLWYDELHTVLRSSPANSIQSILAYAKDSEVDQPPVFFLFTQLTFRIFGFTEATVRLGSVILGILAIPVMYLLGREFVNRESGLFAALLTTVNYFHIYYSQEARFYMLTFLLSALSYLFFVRAYKRVRVVDFIFYGVSSILLLYTHYFGMVIFATQVLTFVVLTLLYRMNDRRFIISGLLTGLLVAASFSPWLPIVLKQNQVESFWIHKPSIFFALEYVYDYFGKDIVQTLIIATLTYLFGRELIKKDPTGQPSRELYLIVLLWLIVSYLIPFVRSITSTPIMHIRYTIITLPAWMIILSVGWSAIKNRKWKLALAGIVVASSLVNLTFFRKHYTKIQKQQMREAAQFVQQKNKKGIPVYSAFPEHYQFYYHNSGGIDYPTQAELDQTDQFWLLQANFFSPDEFSQELRQYEDSFDVIENHQFHKTAAVLLVRKKE